MIFFSGKRGFLAVQAAGFMLFCPGAAFSQITTCEVVMARETPDAASVEALRGDAGRGIAQAQYKLGCLYRWGRGVKKDFTMALEWFMRAADQDNPAARHEIADMYRHDQEGAQGRMLLAAVSLEQQAREGDARAQFSLGMMYVNGLGVDQNDGEAVAWYEKSAAQGYVEAQARLAGMFARGQGVKQDYSKALELGRKAADQGHVMSMLNLGRMYETGAGAPKDLELAKEYYRKASAKGNRVATLLLRQLDGAPQPENLEPVKEVAAASGTAGRSTAAIPEKTAAQTVSRNTAAPKDAGRDVPPLEAAGSVTQKALKAGDAASSEAVHLAAEDVPASDTEEWKAP